MRRLAVEVLHVAVMILMVAVAPHVKVEESFNTQLMYDLIFGGGVAVPKAASVDGSSTASLSGLAAMQTGANKAVNGGLQSYDHHAFPGVVPRTSIGAIAVAAVAAPFARAYDANFQPSTRIHALVMCRIVLGLVSCWSMIKFSRAVSRQQLRSLIARDKGSRKKLAAGAEGPASVAERMLAPVADSGIWTLILITACSFHLMYYMSRPLPNTYALILVTNACTGFLSGRRYTAVALLAFAAAVFRSDVVLFAGPFCLMAAGFGYISFFRGIVVGLAAVAASVALSVAVDSVMWGQTTWPEGMVFYFNTVLNKSSQWGTSPAHWYFTSALPRSMLVAYPLALLAVFWQPSSIRGKRPVRYLAVCFVVFAVLYSFLPHKELRFIYIALPPFFAGAGVLAAHLFTLDAPLLVRYGLRLGLVAAITVSSAVSAGVMLKANAAEYIGAHFLHEAHKAIAQNPPRAQVADEGRPLSTQVRIFLDAYACMNGITRFELLVSDRAPFGVTYSQDPMLFNRSAYEGLEGTESFPIDTMREFQALVVRAEDEAWFMSAANQFNYRIEHGGNAYKRSLRRFAVPKSVGEAVQAIQRLLLDPVVEDKTQPFLALIWSGYNWPFGCGHAGGDM